MNYQERAYWNTRTYGSAIAIKRSWILAAIIVLCISTPGTNWMIPILARKVKRGINIRYGA